MSERFQEPTPELSEGRTRKNESSVASESSQNEAAENRMAVDTPEVVETRESWDLLSSLPCDSLGPLPSLDVRGFSGFSDSSRGDSKKSASEGASEVSPQAHLPKFRTLDDNLSTIQIIDCEKVCWALDTQKHALRKVEATAYCPSWFQLQSLWAQSVPRQQIGYGH